MKTFFSSPQRVGYQHASEPRSSILLFLPCSLTRMLVTVLVTLWLKGDCHFGSIMTHFRDLCVCWGKVKQTLSMTSSFIRQPKLSLKAPKRLVLTFHWPIFVTGSSITCTGDWESKCLAMGSILPLLPSCDHNSSPEIVIVSVNIIKN